MILVRPMSVDGHAGQIPFHTLLKQIDETHRRGRDRGGDDA